MRRIMIAAALALAMIGLAGCSGAPTSSSAATSPDPLTGLRNFTIADLQAASADAKAQTPPDVTASQCYDFLAANLPTLPGVQPGQTVGAILAFQKARDVVNGATQQSGFLKALNLACAPLVNDVNLTLAKLGILAGGVAATGGAIAPVAAVGLPAIGAALPIPIQ